MIAIRHAAAGRVAALVLTLASARIVRADEAAFLRAWESIRGDELARHVEELASDAYQGRAPGTVGETKTLEYLEREFARAGAKPGAPDGTWLQRVPLTEVRAAGTAKLTVTGKRGKENLVIGTQVVVRSGRPGTGATMKGVPIVFGGYGITAPEEKWDDYEATDVRGAAVILLRGEPADSADTTLFKGRALTTHGMPQSKSKNAGRHGARVTLLVHTDASAGHPWSLLSGGGLGGSQIFLGDEPAQEGVESVVHISEPAIRELLGREGQDFDSLAAAARRRGFRARPLGARADLSFTATTRTITSNNVIAKLDGGAAADEAVIYTAHWDHVGTRPSADGDSIFNGAVDNASGTAGLLELAQAYASLPAPTRRTVYLVATTSEEKGLLGSEFLSRHPIVPLARTAAVINLDALFPFDSYRGMAVPGFGASEIEDVLALAAKRVDRVLLPDDQPEVGAYFRSDHYPFAEKGVPAVFAVGNPLPGEMTPGKPVYERFMKYMRAGYHHPDDEYDAATWDMRGIEEDVRVLFETGYRIADDARFPNWRWGSEFRAKRDAMMRGEASPVP